MTRIARHRLSDKKYNTQNNSRTNGVNDWCKSYKYKK